MIDKLENLILLSILEKRTEVVCKLFAHYIGPEPSMRHLMLQYALPGASRGSCDKKGWTA